MTPDNESTTDMFARAVFLTESDPAAAVALWNVLQERIARAALFSSNETSLEDISTPNVPLLTVEHYLAVATAQAPSEDRYQALRRSCDLWESYLHNLERYELLEKEDIKDRDHMIEALAEIINQSDSNRPGVIMPLTVSYAVSRETKIAKHRAQQQIQQEYQKLRALQERRRRLGVAEDETMEGHDDESLARTTSIQLLRLTKTQAIGEWSSALRELPMALMTRQRLAPPEPNQRPSPQLPVQGLKLTHITQMPSGQLQVREEIREMVFRPGWNQPTMSLEELAEREVQDAVQREERQKKAETQAKEAPRRYDQLVKDGLEDVVDLVDASAALDRQWDDWKDENPRGAGNKRGDVGDRNF